MSRAALLRLCADAEPSVEALVENIEFMVAGGVAPDEVSKRIGQSRNTLARRMWRHGRNDLAAYLDDHTAGAA